MKSPVGIGDTRGCIVALLALSVAGIACGRDVQPPGRALYLRHCASCHGDSGRGDGPVAASLSQPPADLTRIAERAGGRFDPRAVLRFIDGRSLVAAHGSREMPVWGAVFEDDLEGQRYPAFTTLLHAKSLTEYLSTIQER